MYPFNHTTQKVEAGGSLKVQAPPGLHSVLKASLSYLRNKTLSKKRGVKGSSVVTQATKQTCAGPSPMLLTVYKQEYILSNAAAFWTNTDKRIPAAVQGRVRTGNLPLSRCGQRPSDSCPRPALHCVPM